MQNIEYYCALLPSFLSNPLFLVRHTIFDFFMHYSSSSVNFCSMPVAVWPALKRLTTYFIWSGEFELNRDKNANGERECQAPHNIQTRNKHSYPELSEWQALNPFCVISERAIAHLTLFNSVQLGTVSVMALAPKYCSPNPAICVISSK